jgi:dTDP-4-amino-4,6-dideoxygalactose transaminase
LSATPETSPAAVALSPGEDGLITFNRPFKTGREFGYIEKAIENRHLSGNGPFTARCSSWLSDHYASARVLLTFSCTSALEMAAILVDLRPGDEVIMPSFTFVSTASAVALRGATPVFVDIRPDTLNVDEEQVAAAITRRTKAILPVHYAGVGAEMDVLMALARENDLFMIEDAAQGIMASYRGRRLGSIGDLGCVSFHETKNIHCGEGGALIINQPEWVERAEILQEKGTNRSKFFRGEVDKYTWVELGSSFLTSEINAAFLWAQIQQASEITDARMSVWLRYHERFEALEANGRLRRPVIPEGCEHNAHIYYLLLRDAATRDGLIERLRERKIQAVFHYLPLHSSPAGRHFGRAQRKLSTTDHVSASLVRLPLWVGMGDRDIDRVVTAVEEYLA